MLLEENWTNDTGEKAEITQLTNVGEMLVAELRRQKFKQGPDPLRAHQVCWDVGEQQQQRGPLHLGGGAHPTFLPHRCWVLPQGLKSELGNVAKCHPTDVHIMYSLSHFELYGMFLKQ